MQYNSENTFQIWMYTVSHSVLILRSVNKEHEEKKGYNIDVEFWGVGYLDLPNMLQGVNIKKTTRDIPKKFKGYQNKGGYKIFELISNENLYYIIAAGCRVGKHTWQDENRILNPYLEYDETIINM